MSECEPAYGVEMGGRLPLSRKVENFRGSDKPHFVKLYGDGAASGDEENDNDIVSMTYPDIVTDSEGDEDVVVDDDDDKDDDDHENADNDDVNLVKTKNDSTSKSVMLPLSKLDLYLDSMSTKFRSLFAYTEKHQRLVKTTNVREFFLTKLSFAMTQDNPLTDSLNRIFRQSLSFKCSSTDFDNALVLGILDLYNEHGKPIVKTQLKPHASKMIVMENEMQEHCYALLQTRKRRTEHAILATTMAQTYYDERFHGVGERLLDVYGRSPYFRDLCKCNFSSTTSVGEPVKSGDCTLCSIPRHVLTTLDRFFTLTKLGSFYFVSYLPGRLVQLCGHYGRRILLDWNAVASLAYYGYNDSMVLHEIKFTIPLSVDGKLKLEVDQMTERNTYAITNEKTGVKLVIDDCTVLCDLNKECWKFSRDVINHGDSLGTPFVPPQFSVDMWVDHTEHLHPQKKRRVTIGKGKGRPLVKNFGLKRVQVERFVKMAAQKEQS